MLRCEHIISVWPVCIYLSESWISQNIKFFYCWHKKKIRKKYLRQPSIDFDLCNILHANFYQLPDERISISSLGNPNCVLHAHVAVEPSVLANMKQARPWMLANLKSICHFQAHPVHQNSVEIFWPEIYQGRLLFGSNLVSFNCKLRTVFVSASEHGSPSGYNRTLVVPYEISKVNFHITKISCQYVRRDLIKFENINISRTS